MRKAGRLRRHGPVPRARSGPGPLDDDPDPDEDADAPEAPKKKGGPRIRKAKKMRKAIRNLGIEQLIVPGTLNPDGGAKPTDAESPGRGYLESLEAYAADAILAKLAAGTLKGYGTGWLHWCSWRQPQGKPVFLDGETKAEMRQDEDDLLLYVAFLGKKLKRAEGTIRQKLFAVKFAHTIAGLSDPLLRRTRLWAALSGIKRWQGAPLRRHPIMPEQLTWLLAFFFATYERGDASALWATICIAWHFLLRSSEYLLQPGTDGSALRVLHGVDLVPRAKGVVVALFSLADELVVYIKGSKTDQFNVGTTRNHHASRGPLCPVRAMTLYEEEHPARLREAKSFTRYTSGAPILRDQVQYFLEKATIATGGDPGRIGSHSLRIGGATALYHAVQDLSYVQRFGRWASEAYHVYLWETHEHTMCMAKKMEETKGTLTTPKPT